LISKTSSTCFGQSFAHLQERETEIFTAYGIVSCKDGYKNNYVLHKNYITICISIFAGHYTVSCKNLSLTLLKTVAYRGGGVGGFKPPPEIPKISVESSIACARRTGILISFCSSLCSHTVVIY